MKRKQGGFLIPAVGICLQSKTAWKLERTGWIKANVVFYGVLLILLVIFFATQNLPFSGALRHLGGLTFAIGAIIQPWLWQHYLGWFAKIEGEAGLE